MLKDKGGEDSVHKRTGNEGFLKTRNSGDS